MHYVTFEHCARTNVTHSGEEIISNSMEINIMGKVSEERKKVALKETLPPIMVVFLQRFH